MAVWIKPAILPDSKIWLEKEEISVDFSYLLLDSVSLMGAVAGDKFCVQYA